MSSCLAGGGRSYGFDLDVVKPSSPLSSRSSHSSSPSSTLSESSNSPPLAISIKRARTPRKRPNQTYNEAAALLSAIYPAVFSTKTLTQLSKTAPPFFSCSFTEPSDLLLTPFPALYDSAFLLHQPPPANSTAAGSLELKRKIPAEKECTSPASNVSWEPGSPAPFDDDFDAESILDEEVEQGIDSIMGNLVMDTPTNDGNSEGSSSFRSSSINPLLRSLIGYRIGGTFELGLGLRFGRNLHRALRKKDEGDWWTSTAVPMQDIVPNLTRPSAPLAMPASEKKKKKQKKVGKEEAEEDKKNAAKDATSTTPQLEKWKAGLGLKLKHEEVLKAWSGRSSMFSDGPDSPNSPADALARLADIDLFPDGGSSGGMREASVLRYKEKRRTRLFSKKIRYHTRKANADRLPRIQASGRFTRSISPSPGIAIEEESQ